MRSQAPSKRSTPSSKQRLHLRRDCPRNATPDISSSVLNCSMTRTTRIWKSPGYNGQARARFTNIRRAIGTFVGLHCTAVIDRREVTDGQHRVHRRLCQCRVTISLTCSYANSATSCIRPILCRHSTCANASASVIAATLPCIRYNGPTARACRPANLRYSALRAACHAGSATIWNLQKRRQYGDVILPYVIAIALWAMAASRSRCVMTATIT